MTIDFGWSYPPGCDGPPDDMEPCEVCLVDDLDYCCCPECEVCGVAGDPACYKEHGMKMNEEQLISRKTSQTANEENCDDER